MMKSKPSSRNLVRRGLLFSIFITFLLILGCSSSITPTYLKEDIPQAIHDILKKEYNIETKARLIGRTIWIYLPVEDLFEKAQKPEKYTEKFMVKQNECKLETGSLKVQYAINVIPQEEKAQDVKYRKEVAEQINNVWSVVRRVLFSMKSSKAQEPQFIYLVIADIKSGFEIRQFSYYQDLKKVSYNFISTGEYHHRTVQDINFLPQLIGDKEGAYLKYIDFSLEDFVTQQIQYRLKLKFQKPEVEQNVDIDKEVMKIVVYTIKTYGLKDFDEAQLNNLATNNKVSLSRAAIWARPTD